MCCHGKTCIGNIVGTEIEDDTHCIAGGGENDDDDDDDDEDDESQSGSWHSTECICISFADLQILYNTIYKGYWFLVNETCYYYFQYQWVVLFYQIIFIFHVIEAAMKSRILMEFLICIS